MTVPVKEKCKHQPDAVVHHFSDLKMIFIPNLAIAGYRSFGKDLQYFDSFAKINLFIGQNNSGKSNVLRFLSEIYQSYASMRGTHKTLGETHKTLGETHKTLGETHKTLGEMLGPLIVTDPLIWHLPDTPPLLLATGVAFDKDELSRLRDDLGIKTQIFKQAQPHLCKLMEKKAELDKTRLCWMSASSSDKPIFLKLFEEFEKSWQDAIKSLSDHEVQELDTAFNNGEPPTIVGRDYSDARVLRKMEGPFPVQAKVKLVPAIRRIGEKGSLSEAFDGTGIIERLAKLQHPDAHSQNDRKLFDSIIDFLRDVVDRPDAKIEIPHKLDTINVRMDGKVLPIESLGTGIHEVVILAAASTVFSEHVVCMEEPELHLNPILQRKLMRYLAKNTKNQYFVTTHSAVLMDTPDAEIYHIRLSDGSSVVERVTCDGHKSAVCEDLGCHPSDLLQANCIIWVEGPSDRIYLNWWLLHCMEPAFVEGIHYSIMFYGGRLLSHLSYEASDAANDVDDFILLRKLNRRSCMLIDRDRSNDDEALNETKQRLIKEFESGPGHAWTTAGREIENYIPRKQLEEAIKAACPKKNSVGRFGPYDNVLKVVGKDGKEVQASKVEVARYATRKFQPDLDVLDLRSQLEKLTEFVKASNPPQKAS